MRLTIAAAAILLSLPAIAQNAEAGLRAYAMAEAGSEYCSDIALNPDVLDTITERTGFDPQADDEAMRDLEEAKAELVVLFGRTRDRSAVCAGLMRSYGPGSPEIEMFSSN